jgi:hypothetical protein
MDAKVLESVRAQVEKGYGYVTGKPISVTIRNPMLLLNQFKPLCQATVLPFNYKIFYTIEASGEIVLRHIDLEDLDQ